MKYIAPAFESKICSPDNLISRVKNLTAPLVFTNGVFDILHRGHVTYLAQAKALGKSLVVALNSDSSVKRLGKGDDRPINILEDRLAVIAALECVDLVTWFDTDTPYDVIINSHPDVLVKGGDWKPDDIVGSREVLQWGGQVHSIPFDYQRSTTSTLAKIRNAEANK